MKCNTSYGGYIFIRVLPILAMLAYHFCEYLITNIRLRKFYTGVIVCILLYLRYALTQPT
jgi:hypothetical protein